MIPDSETNAVFFSDLFPKRHPELAANLLRILKDARVKTALVPGTRDIWYRDYMPVQVGPGRFVQFTYRPDYLVGKYEHLITPPEVAEGLSCIKECVRSDIVLDGGNVVRWTDRAILTDKVYRENRRCAPERLGRRLREQLEVEKIIVIPREPYDRIGHADGVVRFIDGRTVFVNDYAAMPAYRKRLHAALRQAGLEWQKMPYRPTENQTDGIPSAVGNYINFLQVGRTILMPVYGQKEDEAAARGLERAFPAGRVILLPCGQLAREGGILNCVSWTIKA
jgi:agmatine deiminase